MNVPIDDKVAAAGVAAAFAACLAIFPATALADQPGAGDTAVYVTMEDAAADDAATVLGGHASSGESHSPDSASQGGSLPKTGDPVGASALLAVLTGTAALGLAGCATHRAKHAATRR